MATNIFRMASLVALFYVTAAIAAPPSYMLQFPDQQTWKLGHQQK